MMHMNSKILAVTLTLLFVGTAVAVQPGAPGEAVINGVLNNEGSNGDDVLQSEWQTRREVHKLWLTNTNELQYFPCGNPGNGCGDNIHTLYSPADNVLDEGDAGVAGPAVFSYGTTRLDSPLHEIQAELYLGSTSATDVGGVLAGTVITLELFDGDVPIAGANAEYTLPNLGNTPSVGLLGLASAADTVKYQITEFFATPVIIPAGTDLNLRVSATPPPTSAQVHLAYDRDSLVNVLGIGVQTNVEKSWIRLVADSAHVQTWTETLQGKEQNVFPLPTNAPTSDRTVRFAVAQVSGLGDRAILEQLHSAQVIGVDTGTMYFQRGGASDGVTPWGYPTHSPTDATASNDGIFFTYYDLTYPTALVETGEFDFRIFNTNGGWDFIKTINIGGGSFGVKLLATEPAAKTVYLENPSRFIFEVTNKGTVLDDAVLSVGQSSQAWDVSISPGTLLEKMAPGAVRQVVVEVTPPPGVLSGERLYLNLTAQSFISTQAAIVSFQVSITDVAEYGVSLVGDIRAVKISPSETRVFPVTLRNDGNDADKFVVSGSGAPAGWRLVVTPSVLDIPAQSQAPVFVTLTAPANVERGEQFDLRITARRSNDFDTSASRFIQVDVFKQDLFEFLIEGESSAGVMSYVDATTAAAPFVHRMRDEGPDAASDSGTTSSGTIWDGLEGPDGDFDNTAIFKMVFANPGDTDDIISFVPEWGVGYQDVAGNSPCDGAGHPDGWRVRLWQDGQTPAGFQNVNDGQFRSLGFDVPVPKGEERAVFMEAKWQPTDNNCPSRTQTSATGTRGYDPAPFAPMEVEAYSQNNPVNRFVHHMRATFDIGGAGVRQSENMYSGATRDVSIQHGGFELDRVASAIVPVDGTAQQRSQKIPITISNTANEMDTIRVSLPSASRGWSMTIVDVNTDNAFNNDIGFAHTAGGRTSGCSAVSLEDGFVVMECTMGIGDQVTFNLRATAGNTVKIGDELDFKVEAISLDSLQDGQAGTIRDNLDVSLKAAGTFVMDLLPNSSIGRLEYKVQPGEKLVVPISLENSGTNADVYAWAFTNSPTDEKWVAALSHGGFLEIPAGQVMHGFTTIFVPVDAALGTRVGYTIGAQGTASTDSLNIQLEVVAGQSSLNVDTFPTDVVAGFDETNTVGFNVTRLAGDATSVNVRVFGSLPSEISIQNLNSNLAFNADGYVVGGLDLVTTQALGTSRIPVILEVTDNNQNKVRGAYIVNFASANLGFTATSETEPITVIPGGSAVATIKLENLGLSSDILKAEVASLPAGWAANFDEADIPLSPLAKTEVKLNVFADQDAVRGTTSQVSVVFVSNSDPLVSERVDVPFIVGVSELNLSIPEGTQFVAPTEVNQYKISVANVGDVADAVNIRVSVPEELRSLVQVSISEATAELIPDQAEEIVLTVTLAGALAGQTKVPVTLTVNSTNPMLQGLDTAIVNVEMLHHRSADIDKDGFLEYAVDRNQIASDGFESYLDTQTSGIISIAPNMERFLTAEARAAKTVSEVIDNKTVTHLLLFIDGDKDGRQDIFIDINQDLVPDVFWAPARGNFHQWNISKDVNGDGVPEAFIDVDADGALDVMYDFTKGDFTTLLRVDVDGNNQFDYVVDADGNGQADKGETVLFGKDGRVTAILEYRDIDGDGKPDAVYDIDGDGTPDYFIKDGTDTGIDIDLRDVNGDGILDWTYDADGDDINESYYDPATGESGFIDSSASFARLLRDYWYVGALFALVAVLFVVLIVVTRRS
jgi:uncharacterized membrane protein